MYSHATHRLSCRVSSYISFLPWKVHCSKSQIRRVGPRAQHFGGTPASRTQYPVDIVGVVASSTVQPAVQFSYIINSAPLATRAPLVLRHGTRCNGPNPRAVQGFSKDSCAQSATCTAIDFGKNIMGPRARECYHNTQTVQSHGSHGDFSRCMGQSKLNSVQGKLHLIGTSANYSYGTLTHTRCLVRYCKYNVSKIG